MNEKPIVLYTDYLIIKKIQVSENNKNVKYFLTK